MVELGEVFCSFFGVSAWWDWDGTEGLGEKGVGLERCRGDGHELGR